eukprot:jgi/Chlat1/3264/Chrsp22S03521
MQKDRRSVLKGLNERLSAASTLPSSAPKHQIYAPSSAARSDALNDDYMQRMEDAVGSMHMHAESNNTSSVSAKPPSTTARPKSTSVPTTRSVKPTARTTSNETDTASATTTMAASWTTGPLDPAGTRVQLSEQPVVCMSVRGGEAVAGTTDHALYAMDVATARLSRTLWSNTLCAQLVAPADCMWGVRYGKNAGHTDWVTSVAHTSDGRVISGGMDGNVCLWERAGSRCTYLKGHTASVAQVAACEGDNTAVSCSYDKTLRLWDTRTKREIACMSGGHGAAVLVFALSSQSKSSEGSNGEITVVSGSRDGGVAVWDVSRAQLVGKTREAHAGHVTALAWIEPGRYATGGQDGAVRVWDVRSKECVESVCAHSANSGTGAVGNMELASVSGTTYVVTAGADRTVKVLEPRLSYKTLFCFDQHKDFIYSLKLHGTLALSGDGSGALHVQDFTTGQLLYGMGANRAAVRCIGIAGSKLVTAGDDGCMLVHTYA